MLFVLAAKGNRSFGEKKQYMLRGKRYYVFRGSIKGLAISLAALLFLLAALPGGAWAQSMTVVPADVIMAKVKLGETAAYDHIIVRGNLSSDRLALPAKEILRIPFEVKVEPSDSPRMANSSIIIKNSWIDGDVDFSNAMFQKTVRFENTIFSRNASFQNCVFTEEASFVGCRFDGTVDFRRSHFKGAADLSWSEIWGPAEFSDSQFDNYAIFYLTDFSARHR